MEHTILVVDDEYPNLIVMKTIFEKKGFQVFTTREGSEALEIIEKNKVDIVITDIAMPKMDGMELLNRIKQRYPYIQVIMMTGYRKPGSAAQSMEIGASHFMEKPIDLNKLLEAVNNLIGFT